MHINLTLRNLMHVFNARNPDDSKSFNRLLGKYLVVLEEYNWNPALASIFIKVEKSNANLLEREAFYLEDILSNESEGSGLQNPSDVEKMTMLIELAERLQIDDFDSEKLKLAFYDLRRRNFSISDFSILNLDHAV